jgi:ubiquinone/menaquinone biosynthesis C-methylase UbiE
MSRSSSSQTAMREWDVAYEAHPTLASDFAFEHIAEFLTAHPGERVYEVGFGSGMNLLWARENGWDVAGCEVADTPLALATTKLPGADLRKESIVDCSAPSEHYDVVFERAVMSNLAPPDVKKAIAQIRRILKPGGVFLFNPYATEHTKPFPEMLPTQHKWDMNGIKRLFPETKWETVDARKVILQYKDDQDGQVEATWRVVVRKTTPPSSR